MAKKITLDVKGMSCEHCAAAVTKAAKSIKGVMCVKVDVQKGKASFNYPDEDALNKAKAAIVEAGYEVA